MRFPTWKHHHHHQHQRPTTPKGILQFVIYLISPRQQMKRHERWEKEIELRLLTSKEHMHSLSRSYPKY